MQFGRAILNGVVAELHTITPWIKCTQQLHYNKNKLGETPHIPYISCRGCQEEKSIVLLIIWYAVSIIIVAETCGDHLISCSAFLAWHIRFP